MEQRAGNESSRGGKAVQECERGITWGQMKDEKVIKYMRTEEIGDWVHCPKCGSKTRTKIQVDTTAKNLPVFCPYWGIAQLVECLSYIRQVPRFDSGCPDSGQAKSYKTANRWWTVTHL